MNFQILPNWCKKLGLFLFLFCIFSFYEGFMQGVSGLPMDSVEFKIFDKDIEHLFNIISMLGMVIYIFSKEKVEDDFIDKLRLESYQLTALIGLGVSIFLFTCANDINLTLDYFIILFLWTYMITFAVKKRLD